MKWAPHRPVTANFRPTYDIPIEAVATTKYNLSNEREVCEHKFHPLPSPRPLHILADAYFNNECLKFVSPSSKVPPQNSCRSYFENYCMQLGCLSRFCVRCLWTGAKSDFRSFCVGCFQNLYTENHFLYKLIRSNMFRLSGEFGQIHNFSIVYNVCTMCLIENHGL